MAYSSYAALTTFFQQESPDTLVIGYGVIDGIFFLILFAVGSSLVANGLFRGLDSWEHE